MVKYNLTAHKATLIPALDAPAAAPARLPTGAVPIASHGGVGALGGDGDAGVFGALANGAGTPASGNATVVPTGVSPRTTITNQAVATYLSIKGDSGAPVVHTDSNGKSRLLGINIAHAKSFFNDSTGQITHQRSPGGSPNVDAVHPQFGIFSTWENISDDLGQS